MATSAFLTLAAAAWPPGALAAAPTVKSLKPAQGPQAGGNKVTIKGSGFTGATAVQFGAVAAASFTVKSASAISAVAPPGVGVASVTVTTSEGVTPEGPNDEYEYVAVGPPSVSRVSPNHAPVKGGKKVHVIGTNLDGATAVDFGSTPASFTVSSATTIVATVPPGAALVDVTVTTPEGTSAVGPSDEFEYTDKGPQVSGLSPDQAPAAGGSEVAVLGENFVAVSGVDFGGLSVPFTVLSDGEIVATSPAWTVEVLKVHVTTFYGTSNDFYCHKGQPCVERDHFRVVEPTVSSVSPSHGPLAGGTPVTVTGTGFAVGGARTSFAVGKVLATGVECPSISTCTFIAPAGKAGAQFVNVKVESDDPGPQGSRDDPAAVFTYE